MIQDLMYSPIELDILDREAEATEDAIDSLMGFGDISVGSAIDQIRDAKEDELSPFAYDNI